MQPGHKLKFLADMGISQRTVCWLRDTGFDSIHLRDQKLQTIPDKEILTKAEIENRIILTCDLDFRTLLSFSKESLPSVIIFRDYLTEDQQTLTRSLRS